MTEHLWFTDGEGHPFSLTYEELNQLDPEVYPQLLKPTGKFSYSAAAFLALPITKTPFYLEGWLPRQGKAMIYGSPKVGKSFLAVQLARCIGAGELFLGIPTESALVLYLQGELGVGVLQGRMRTTGQAYENVFVWTSFSIKLDKREGQDELENELHAIHPEVLIVDPFIKVLSGDENESHDVVPLCDFFDKLIEDFGLSVLLLHHAGKDLSRGSRGSSVLGGWVDSSIEMRRLASNNREELRACLQPKLLRHALLPPEPLRVVLGPELEFALGEKRGTIKDAVLEFLVEAGPSKLQAIIGAGIGSRRSVYEAKKALVEEGKVEDLGEGIYRALEGGE